MRRSDTHVRIHAFDSGPCNNRLALPYVLLLEQKLTVQIGHIDSVEVDLERETQSNEVVVSVSENVFSECVCVCVCVLFVVEHSPPGEVLSNQFGST